jgi:hypothetical protein
MDLREEWFWECLVCGGKLVIMGAKEKIEILFWFFKGDMWKLGKRLFKRKDIKKIEDDWKVLFYGYGI